MTHNATHQQFKENVQANTEKKKHWGREVKFSMNLTVF
jgi:hypothetical protein